MTLSIVIVNYNVKYFLEQCLRSVRESVKGIDAEIFVVDNASQDDSLEMLRSKFPEVILIANKENLGFSKANNQALRRASGKYKLLLNPDTVVQEDTFRTCIRFMEEHPDCGGLGVKMLDGKGNFLPESKRGLPTPWVSFYKIFGLSTLFPKSARFARYHMGHLDKDQNHEIEILAGAFMLMRKEALDKVGLLDEDYFMYGEDIDLSYRIVQGGYKNFYLADTSIIHYKGESTKKGSLNYVYIFYKAMVIFARKHFSGSYASLFNVMITLAIYLRAGISVIKRITSALALPILDAGIMLTGLHYIKEYWEQNNRFISGGEYPAELVWTAFPLYALAWILSIFLNGGYERPAKITGILKGIGIGSVVILVGYSLLDEALRFSRAITLLGSFWTALAVPLSRVLLQKITGKKLLAGAVRKKRCLIVGSAEESQRVEELVRQSSREIEYLAWVSPARENQDERFVGKLEDLEEIVGLMGVDEVIFCSKDLSGKEILAQMGSLNHLQIEIKIAPSESEFVIGSNTIDSQGAWYTVQFNDISKATNRRAKRLLDVTLSLLFLLFSPLLIWFMKGKAQFLRNIFKVLGGQKTWLGYDTSAEIKHLPKLRPGVLQTTTGSALSSNNPKAVNHINQLYAKNYRSGSDLNFIIKNISKLGG